MKILLTADLHLTECPADEHRWLLFSWLVEQIKKHAVSCVVLAGDVTQNKNFHSSVLTNRLVESIRDLGVVASQVYWIRGNHDYVDENLPFFNFVGKFKNVVFVTEPTHSEKANALMLPNTRDYQTAWKGIDWNKYDYIFCHQTFDGSTAENGQRLPGIPPSVFAKFKGQVWSGDIHVPQKIGSNINHIGAPYRVRYGDSFDPRVVLLDTSTKTHKSLRFPTKNKMTIDLRGNNPKKFSIQMKDHPLAEALGQPKPGDQVKVRVHLRREAYPEWPELRRKIIAEAAEMGLELAGPELIAVQDKPSPKGKGQNKPVQGVLPLEALADYAEKEALPDPLRKAGERFLKGALAGK